MKKPEIPLNEKERLIALRSFEILDTLSEESFDSITRLASYICEKPIALVSLIDKDRQWFKSAVGLNVDETPRELAFCAHAINQPKELFIVKDASKDERFFDHPFITGGPQVKFYAGAPLNTVDGFSLGTLCVIDNKPGDLTEAQKQALKDLANQVVAQLQLRKQNRLLIEKNKSLKMLKEQFNAISYRLAHDLKTPIYGIRSVTGWIKDEYSENIDSQLLEWLNLIDSRSDFMERMTNKIMEYSRVGHEKLEYEVIHLDEFVKAFQKKILCEDIEIEINNELEELYFDKTKLRQILSILLLNSKDFCEENNCQVNIHLRKSETGITLRYQDNGPGIPKTFTERVFEIFETLGAKKTHTGIGLAVLRLVTQRMGGTVKLEKPGKQTTGVNFLFEFPLKSKEE